MMQRLLIITDRWVKCLTMIWSIMTADSLCCDTVFQTLRARIRKAYTHKSSFNWFFPGLISSELETGPIRFHSLISLCRRIQTCERVHTINVVVTKYPILVKQPIGICAGMLWHYYLVTCHLSLRGWLLALIILHPLVCYVQLWIEKHPLSWYWVEKNAMVLSSKRTQDYSCTTVVNEHHLSNNTNFHNVFRVNRRFPRVGTW